MTWFCSTCGAEATSNMRRTCDCPDGPYTRPVRPISLREANRLRKRVGLPPFRRSSRAAA